MNLANLLRIGQLEEHRREHILAQEDGEARWLRAVTELSRAFALAVPYEEALSIRDDVRFFQAERPVRAKSASDDRKTDEELDLAIRQIVSRAIFSDEVVDIFAAASRSRTSRSSRTSSWPRFARHGAAQPRRRAAAKLLAGAIKTRGRRNVVQARRFAELLEQTVLKYQNRAIETAQMIGAARRSGR